MTFMTYSEIKYDSQKHKIEFEKVYATPVGNVTMQTVTTCPQESNNMLKNLSTRYRTTVNGKQVAWGEEYNDVAKQTLLKLLEPFEVKSQTPIKSDTQTQ
jgi:hypothetical protein